MPFATPLHRDTHFRRHGHEFGATDEFDYERMADAFMDGGVPVGVREALRIHGDQDRVRFRDVDRTLGIVRDSTTIVRSFYIVNAAVVRRHGNEAAYFMYECGRINL